jgi:hypothetical protein
MPGRTAALLGAMLLLAQPARAYTQSIRNIDFMIGADVGGGYDIYARTIARHLGRFIPGNPTIVPRNMPGAGSGRVAFYMYSAAPKDGSAIAAIYSGVIIDPLLDEHAIGGVDPTKFNYLASANSDSRVCVTFYTSKVTTYDDALRRKTILGATAGGGSTRDYALFHKKATEADFDIVTGYKGTSEIFFAMERGEVDGMCGLDWTSLKFQRPDWVRDKKVNILVQDNLEPDAELSAMGVPQIWPYLHNEEDRKAVELVISQQIFSRPYLAPPAISPPALSLLRAAFEATLKDKEFLEDSEKRRIVISPSSGETIQKLVNQLYALPKSVVERSKNLIRE